MDNEITLEMLEELSAMPTLHDNHVLLWYGADLAAIGYETEEERMACPFCHYDDAVILHCEEVNIPVPHATAHDGKTIHFVVCGACGTRGPWGKTESEAARKWNAVYDQRPNFIFATGEQEPFRHLDGRRFYLQEETNGGGEQ